MKKIISIVLALCMIIGCASALAEIKNMPDSDADEAKVMYRLFMKTKDTSEFTAFKKMLQGHGAGQLNNLDADIDMMYHLYIAGRIQSAVGKDDFQIGTSGDIYMARYTINGGAANGMVCYDMIFPSTISGKCLCVSVRKYNNADEAFSYKAYADDKDVETEFNSLANYIVSSSNSGSVNGDYLFLSADCDTLKEIAFSSESVALMGALHD